MDALVNEKGSNIIVFRPKSARRARGGKVELIRMFDWRGLQQGAIIDNRGNKAYPPNVPMD